MKLGYFTQPFHPTGKNISQSLLEDHEAAVIADRNGYSEALFGEHVTDAYETITSSLSFVASLIHSTKDIKLGTGTINIPNAHPVSIASTISMIDHMLKGRFLFGISMGALPTDWEVFETLNKNREEMFEEAMEQILKIWTCDPPYKFKGKFWNITTEKTLNLDMGLGKVMHPFQNPHPEILCTALMPNSIGLFKAAQKGWSPVSSNFLQEKNVLSHWDQYSKGCASVNVVADYKKWRVAKMVFVNADNQKAIRYAKNPSGPYGQCINQILKKLKLANKLHIIKECSSQNDSEITLEYCLDKLVIAGDPSNVLEQVNKFVNKTGPFGTLLYVGVDWQDPTLARESMELMANKVIHNIEI